MWHGVFENWRITKILFQRKWSSPWTLHKYTGVLNSSISRAKSTFAQQYLAWTTVWIIKKSEKELKLLKTSKEHSQKSKTTQKRIKLGSVHKYFGGGLGKMEGAKTVLSYQKGDQNVFCSKGGSKKFSQIESTIKIKMHNLLPKLTRYSLRLDLYFKIFPGPSAGPALHLTLKMPPLAHPQVRLAFV